MLLLSRWPFKKIIGKGKTTKAKNSKTNLTGPLITIQITFMGHDFMKNSK